MDEHADAPAQPFAPRLFRAIALVMVGATVHLMLPSRSDLALPRIRPLQVVAVDAQAADPAPQPYMFVENALVLAPLTVEPRPDAPAPAPPPAPAAPPAAAPAAATVVAIGAQQPPSAVLGDLPGVDISGPSAQPEPEPAAGTAAETVVSAALPRVPDLAAASVRLEPVALAARPRSEEELVRRLLDEFEQAFARLDVGATKAVWPTVDSRALKRAFGQLSAQRLTLESCGIKISGATANARCRGSATYQPRVGARTPQVATGEWTFDLSKEDAAWRIVNTFVQ